MTIRVAYANVHNSRAAIAHMLKQNPDALGLGEAYNRRPYVSSRPRYRVTIGRGARDQRRGAYDNPILTRKSLRSLGQLAFEASERAAPAKIAPDRWITLDAFVKDGKRVAVICGHPNASVKGKPISTPRVREYHEFMTSLGRVIDFARKEDWIPVVMMDANFPRGATSPGWTDPVELFKAKRLSTHWSGIDVIAWGGRLKRSSARVIPAKTLRSDHPGLIVNLV